MNRARRPWIGRILRRLHANDDGATILEFALIATPFFILILGLTDLGFREYAAAMLQGSINEAARQVTIGNVTTTTINTFVQGRMATVVPGGTVTVTPSSYYDYTGIQTMEPLTKDANSNGVLDINDCFTDYNNDGVRDTNSGTANSLGNSDDVVYYTATLTFPSFVPVPNFILPNSTETVTATTMIKNQPYASQPTPPTVCRTS